MKEIKKILIFGALPKTAEDTKLYETIVQACRDIAENISSPIDTANFKWTDAERYERALQKVHDAIL